jgi:hypothetical protein
MQLTKYINNINIYERDGRNIEGSNDGWMTYLAIALLVAVTGYLYKVNKELQNKGNLINKT